MGELLFHDSTLADFLSTRMITIENSIETIPESQFISTMDGEILAHLISQHEVAPLEIYEDNAKADRRETKIKREDYRGFALLDGLSLDVSIPYTGEVALWRQRPNPWRDPFPRGEVIAASESGGHIKVSVCAPVSDGEDVFNRLLERALDDM